MKFSAEFTVLPTTAVYLARHRREAVDRDLPKAGE
jgi:hypothetical protein